jgi:lipoprotein signal peptidase
MRLLRYLALTLLANIDYWLLVIFMVVVSILACYMGKKEAESQKLEHLTTSQQLAI